jgi:hypothetical protein
MNRMTQAVLEAGIITPRMLAEMKRFSVALDQSAEVAEPKGLEEAAQIIAEALQSADYAIVRETDLDVLSQYLENHIEGSLHFEALDSKPVEFDVAYCVTRTGDYVIAWNSESISDEMTNGMTFLRTVLRDVRFKDVRELWYGEKKAFMICTPREGGNG